MIEIPKALCWDYPDPPRDPLWRLQRIGQFFPVFGREPETVRALEENLARIRIPEENALLVRIYAEEYRRRGILPAR